MTGSVAASSGSDSINRLEHIAREFDHVEFRHSFFARQLKVFLAAQIRALRGELSQEEFGKRIGKPQSVVSRLERESYGKVSLQTLIDIATKLDIGLIVRFVTFPTFVKWTNDYSSAALKPAPYNKADIEAMVKAAKEPSDRSDLRSDDSNISRLPQSKIDKRSSITQPIPESSQLSAYEAAAKISQEQHQPDLRAA